MLFLLSALGSAGDVHPFIAIAQALRARGHEVRMIAAAPFEGRIVRAGIAFTPLGTAEDYQRLLQRPDLWHPRRGARLLLDELQRRLPESYAVTAAAVRPRDTVLVGSTLSWGMRLVQESTALPGATVHLSPFLLPSAAQPPVLPGLGDVSWMPGWLARLLLRAADAVLDGRVAPGLNRLRAELGLPPVRRVWSRWMHSPDLVLGAWPDWFAPAQADWPPQAKATGFPLFDEAGAAPDPALSAFLDAGVPPVGITPGSAMAHGGRFFARALEACRSLGRRALLLTPYREQLPASLPEDVHHAAWAPFGTLLPRLSALVHHGGIGTCAQALAAGIPQLVVPFAHDQFDNAARLRRLGVAEVQAESAPAADWVAALCRLDGMAAATRRCADRMAADGPGAQAAALALERLGVQRL